LLAVIAAARIHLRLDLPAASLGFLPMSLPALQGVNPMHSTRRSVWLPAVLAVFGVATATPAQERTPLRPADFDQLRQIIRPAAGEARWAKVEWMPASDIWAARKKAAAAGKPLFLWYMAGEPLATC
jgi:hypothetical protein